MSEYDVDQVLNPWHAAVPSARVAQAGGGGTRDLVQVVPAVVRGISSAAGVIHQELGVVGRQADDTTLAAAQGLTRENFDLGPALKAAGDLWHSQVTTLHQACHKIEQSLEANANGHAMVEDANEMLMSDIARHFQ